MFATLENKILVIDSSFWKDYVKNLIVTVYNKSGLNHQLQQSQAKKHYLTFSP